MSLPLVSCAFDGGNIETKAVVPLGGGGVQLRLAVRPDIYTNGTDKMAHAQWFYFKVSRCKGVPLCVAIEDIESVCSYPEGFKGYEPVCSYDRKVWWRARGATFTKAMRRARSFQEAGDEDDDEAATVAAEGDDAFLPLARYNSDARTFRPPLPPVREKVLKPSADVDGSRGVLQWQLTPDYDTVYVAYWTPYSMERHADAVAELSQSPLCDAWSLGLSLDGRDLDVLTFGTGPLKLWVAARQHPGETMAEWAAEGFARKLADADDPKARKLRERATISVVPNMCPDGSFRGHLRTNASGANLNREWASGVYGDYVAPSLERSPEVYYMLKHLDERGCDGYVDIHGDEEIEANFTAGAEGCPCYDAAMSAHYEGFCQHFCKATPDFQHAPGVEGRGYEPTPPGEANLSVCTNAIATRYGCLAVTLEQPFKDSTFHTPEPVCGWSGPRALKLGAALVDALLDTVPAIAARKQGGAGPLQPGVAPL